MLGLVHENPVKPSNESFIIPPKTKNVVSVYNSIARGHEFPLACVVYDISIKI